MRVVVIAALMLAVGLAGCADGSPEKTDGKGSVKELDGEDLGHLTDGEGALRGIVTDDIGVPIKDANVALMKTNHFARTQSDGTFLMTNVTVGTYTLRTDHPDYHSVEEPLQITNQRISKIQIVLVPLVAASPDYRPHIHDYWAGRTEITVIDGTAFEYHEPYDDTGPYSESFGRYYDTTTAGNVHPCVWTDNGDEVYFNNRLFWFDDPEQLVYAGTARIEIIIDWSETDYPYYTDFALAWAGANSTRYQESPLIQKGESYFIDVDPNDWDSSHQSFSLWELWMCLDTATDTDVPRLFLGEFTATVKLHRMEGAIPHEKAHPVFWPESGVIPVITEETGDKSFGGTYSLSRSTYNSNWVIRPGEGQLVPPGTEVLTARVEWDYGGPAIEEKAWSLTYRPANERFWDMKDPGDMIRPDPVESGDGYRTYEIRLEPGQSDQFYQKKSAWFFMLNFEGEEDDWGYQNPCVNCSISVNVRIEAHKSGDFLEG